MYDGSRYSELADHLVPARKIGEHERKFGPNEIFSRSEHSNGLRNPIVIFDSAPGQCLL